MSRVFVTRTAFLLWLCFFVAACGVPLEAEQEGVGVGGESPRAVASTFFTVLNEALRDPQLKELETRRIWAERLASYFAPSERIDQRYVLDRMLASFGAGLEELEANHILTLEITYSDIVVTEDDAEHASVRLVDGTLRYRRVRVEQNGYRSVLRDEQQSLSHVLGLQEESFPVVQVNGRWFMTEQLQP